MQKILLSALALLPLTLKAQINFTLKGKVGSDNAKAYLLYHSGDTNITDSTTLKNGTFLFTGTIPNPTMARLIIDHKGVGFANTRMDADMNLMYLDKSVSIYSKDSLKRATFSGSPVNREYLKYTAFMAPSKKVLDDINAEFQHAPAEKRKDRAFVDSFSQRLEKAAIPFKAKQYEFIKANPDSYVTLAVLREAAGNIIDVQKNEPVFNSLSDRVKESPEAQHFKEMMDTKKTVSIGQMAPAFTQNDVNDKPVSLSDFKGKYVLIDFWASWCVPCRAENPNVVKAYNQYKDKNFTVLSVSLDRPGKKEDWLKAIKMDGLEWTQVSDLKFWDNAVAKLYGIRSVPQNFLVDKDGKIIAENLRGEELSKTLDQLLK